MEDDRIVITQKKFKLMIGGLGIALPTILFLGNLWLFGEAEELGSISGYYYSDMRDVFVGVFFTIGVFLLTYEGYQQIDRLLSSIGGVFALVVALIPTSAPGVERDPYGSIHLLAAAGFVFILMIFSIFLFTRSDGPKTRRKIVRNVIYYVCGILMLGSLILLVVTEMNYMDLPINNSTFWLEYVATNAFGTAWLVKAEGLFFLNDDPILKMTPWELLGLLILVLLALGSVAMLTSIFIF